MLQAMSGQATSMAELLHFGFKITRMVMLHICVSLVSPSQKNKMASIIDFICEASASVKAKFDGTNLPMDKLNNFIDEMFCFVRLI